MVANAIGMPFVHVAAIPLSNWVDDTCTHRKFQLPLRIRDKSARRWDGIFVISIVNQLDYMLELYVLRSIYTHRSFGTFNRPFKYSGLSMIASDYKEP